MAETIDLRAALDKIGSADKDESFPDAQEILTHGMAMANAAKRLLIKMAAEDFPDNHAKKSMAYMIASLCLFRQAEIAATRTPPNSAPHRAWQSLCGIITKEAIAASLEEPDDDSVA